MLVVGLLSWWYGAGWRDQMRLISERFARSTDYFSITLLLKSLFAPFRQISAGQVRGSIDVQVRAWIDRLVSRCIGAMVRTVIIIIGVIALIFEVLFGTLRLLLWPFLPLVPIIGLVLMLSGWIPWLS